MVIMNNLKEYILEKLKISKNIKNFPKGEFNWQFIIDLDIISIMYTGGHNFNDNDNNTKKKIQQLFNDIVKNINNIDFNKYNIDIKINNDSINILNINEHSLMFAIEQLINLVENVNATYISDIEYMVPMDQIKKDLDNDHILWHNFETYIYDNVEH